LQLWMKTEIPLVQELLVKKHEKIEEEIEKMQK